MCWAAANSLACWQPNPAPAQLSPGLAATSMHASTDIHPFCFEQVEVDTNSACIDTFTGLPLPVHLYADSPSTGQGFVVTPLTKIAEYTSALDTAQDVYAKAREDAGMMHLHDACPHPLNCALTHTCTHPPHMRTHPAPPPLHTHTYRHAPHPHSP